MLGGGVGGVEDGLHSPFIYSFPGGRSMTPIDDLNEGQWIAIHSEKVTEEDYCQCGCGKRLTRGVIADGAPLQVIAISLPFILVEEGDKKYTVDVRRTNVVKLTKKYVKEFNYYLVKRKEERNERIYTPSHCPPFDDMFGTLRRVDDCEE